MGAPNNFNVYLAGKISGERWRDDLLMGHVGTIERQPTNYVNDINDDWPIAENAVKGGFKLNVLPIEIAG
jgi:hypothetical protein